ncbi:TetR-like C-terminal domain-containing protein [Marininema halotolerans]|uniref:DNA-binding transcriptional regulator, AcrR family n=1 Tax=Marininema halotolerans TaxID=1155944 RepID=A0A1I6RDX6_9BACL|nr:TetR-like C-terminal domain-containing protein [Marininema halotolerans]SFS62866.1 DNA-binding transcriptional regulator, AcrR family [Marininema halotolerans]
MARTRLEINHLLQVTADLADQNGLEAVTLTSLAEKLGIRAPSLYNHIEGLTDLRMKLAIYGFQQIYEVLIHATDGQSGVPAIMTFGKAYLSFVRNHPGLYEATTHAPNPQHPQIQELGFTTVIHVLQLLQPLNIESNTAVHITRGLRSLLHGFASLEQHKGFTLPLDVDHSIEVAIESFLTGALSLHTKNHRPPSP